MIPDPAAHDVAAPPPGADAFPTIDRPTASAPAPPPRFVPSRTMIGGAAAVVVLGLGLGLLLAPASHVGNAPDPDQLEARASDGDPHLQIEMNRKAPPPQPVPTGGGKIDAASTIMQPAAGGALSPAAAPDARTEPNEHDGGVMGVLARLLRHESGLQAAQEAQQDAAPRSQLQTQPGPATAPVQIYPPAAPPEAPVRPVILAATQARPSFDCATARVRAQQIVCSDPQLAAADRRMAHAFREARVAGVPYAVLAAQQQRWYRARDRAESPEALASAYDQRINELQSQRDNAWQRPRGNDDGDGGDDPRL